MTVVPPSRVQALARTPRLVDEVVANLRDSIIEGVLPAGTQLPQVALAAQLGVSRTPLREALRILESEGLVRTSNSNLSVEVVEMSTDDLRQMYQLREVIDGLAARLAARHGLTPEEQTRAEELLLQMEESIEPFDPVLRSRAHSQFHELFAVASRNAKVQSFEPLIRTSSAALYVPVAQAHAEVNLPAQDPEKTYKDILSESQAQHREILAAVLSRDPAAAESAARQHIRRTIGLVHNL